MSQLTTINGFPFPGVPGVIVDGDFAAMHTTLLPNWGQPVFNDSGIGLNMAKILAMPGGPFVWKQEPPYEEHFERDRTEAIINWQGPWTQRLAFKDWVMGYATAGANQVVLKTGGASSPTPTSGNVLSRVIPIQHPEMPWLYATDCKLRTHSGAPYNRDDIAVLLANGNPAMGDDGRPAFDPMIAFGEPDPTGGPWDDGLAHYSVRYQAPKYQVLTDQQLLASPYAGSELGRYVSRFANYAIKSIGLPVDAKNAFKFTPAPGTPASLVGQTVNTAEMPLLQPMFQLEYIWKEIPFVPWQTLSQCIGCVNSVQFDPLGSFFPLMPGTLLCQTPKADLWISCAGRWMYDLTLRFDWLGSGWNNFPAFDGNYYPATFGGAIGGRTLYQSNDFNQIFTVSNI